MMKLRCASYFTTMGFRTIQRRLFASKRPSKVTPLERGITNACKKGNFEEAMVGFGAMLKDDPSPPSQYVLGALFHACRGQKTQDELLSESSRHLDVLLSHAQQVSNPKIALATAQINCLVTYGRTEEVWHLFELFKERWQIVPRQGSLMLLLELLLNGGHLDRSLKLMNMINDKGYGLTSELTQRILSKAIEGSSQDKRWSEAVWIVLKIYRNQSLPLEDGVAPQLVQWFKSNGGECIEDASIHLSGRCISCGHQLEYGLSKIEQSTLMDYTSNVLEKEAFSFEDFDREEKEINVFKKLLKNSGPFGAVIDGMNVAHVRNPIRRIEKNSEQVFEVCRYMLAVTKRPVLAVMRSHLMRKIFSRPGNSRFNWDQMMLQQKQYKEQGIYLFSTSNRVADDKYFIHAAVSHPDTVLVTDDLLGDYKELIPSDLKKIFQKWQDTHQVRPSDGTISKGIYKLPPAYNRVVQWTKDNIHVPYDNGQWICIKFNNSDLHIQ